ncbi:21750_t:CDS:1, partial [Dentiscutata erythropus]
AAEKEPKIRKMSKKSTQNATITRNESSATNESVETVAASTCQDPEAQDSDRA